MPFGLEPIQKLEYFEYFEFFGVWILEYGFLKGIAVQIEIPEQGKHVVSKQCN
jgi:hypothetical protein